jgi:Myb-like DNA-binding domain
MIILQLLPSIATGKVDISLLLGSRDEEEEKSTKRTAPRTTTSTGVSPTTTIPTTSAPAAKSSIPTKRLQSALPIEFPARKRSKWSADEDASIIELRGSGMKWDDISKRLPGRSAISCRLHYQNYLERRSEWDEDKKNKLVRLYER